MVRSGLEPPAHEHDCGRSPVPFFHAGGRPAESVGLVLTAHLRRQCRLMRWATGFVSLLSRLGKSDGGIIQIGDLFTST